MAVADADALPRPPAAGRRPSRTRAFERVGWLALLALALVLPQLLTPSWVYLSTRGLAYSLAVLSLGLLTGINGQISIGHGAFFAIGAYTTVILVDDHSMSWLLTTAVAGVICFAVGIVVGLPALRIRGLYLGVVTLAVATVFRQSLEKFSDLTGGSTGRRVDRADWLRAPEWTGLADDQFKYYLVLAVVIVAFVLVRNVVNSRVGRSLIAIRDNEVAAESAGVPVARMKVLTFGVSALLAGVAGSLSIIGSQIPSAAAGSFTIALSITFLVALVVGGATSLLGPVIGAAFVVYLPDLVDWVFDLSFMPEVSAPTRDVMQPVILGALLIVLMISAPGGMVGLYRTTSARFTARRRSRSAKALPHVLTTPTQET